jgi:hypothetical protein
MFLIILLVRKGTVERYPELHSFLLEPYSVLYLRYCYCLLRQSEPSYDGYKCINGICFD